METHSCKTKKLRIFYNISGAKNISINITNGKLTISKLKSPRLSYNLVETMQFVMNKFKSKKGLLYLNDSPYSTDVQ